MTRSMKKTKSVRREVKLAVGRRKEGEKTNSENLAHSGEKLCVKS